MFHTLKQRFNDSVLMLSFFACWVILHVFFFRFFFFKINFFKNSFRNTIRVSNCLDPDLDYKLFAKVISR